MRILKFNLLLLIFICFALNAYAATMAINGTTYNASGDVLPNVNVTVEVYAAMGETPLEINSTLSNGSGYYSIYVTDDSSYNYKLIPKKYDNTNANVVSHIGASLPDFPYDEFTTMLNLSAVNFYLKEAVTLNINATNQSGNGPINFTYQIKDKILGYPIKSDWQTKTYNLTAHLPANRSYSIMIYPDQSMPISYNLDNISKYPSPKVINVTFDTSEQKKWVSGYMKTNDSVNFTKVDVIAYLIEPGNMVFYGQAMPHNMSVWRGQSGGVFYGDVFNVTNNSVNGAGFYNMTLVGPSMGGSIMLLAVAKVNNTDEYYGALKNISLNNNSNDVTDFNFTLYKLPGTPRNISLEHMVEQGPSTYYNVTVPQANFNFINSSNHSINATAHLEVELDYSSLYTEGPSLTWMTDVAQGSGSFTLPLLNYSVKKLNLYTNNYAPVKKSYTQPQVEAGNINITLNQFNPGGISESDVMADIFIAMYKSSSTCDVPVPPPSTCVLASDAGEDNFKPLNAVVSGGKISFRMRKNSNNITVHYKNVDLLASGPPDVAFDSSASQNQTGSALEAAWRFGSQGPTIYDSVLVGIPYSDIGINESSMSILINNLYDENWNKIWNSTSNPNGENYSAVANNDYADFNQRWFNATLDGMNCSTTDITANCFVNTTTNTIWLQIPHFSGIGPTVKSTSIGGVTVKTNASRFKCVDFCTVYINVTNTNHTLSANPVNITINNSDSLGIVNYFNISKYNTSAYVWDGTNLTTHNNFNFTLYNGNITTEHLYGINISKSISNDTVWNFTYNINDTKNLTLTLTLDGTPPTIDSISAGDPSSTSATITVTTNENSTCRYSGSDLNYTNMSSSMTADAAGTSHTVTNSSLSASTSYTFYASCADIVGNQMNTSSSVTFTTDAASTTSTGGGGGGGGGAATTAGVSTSKLWSTFAKGINNMTISKTAIAFTELVITSLNEKTNTEITVTKLDSKPTGTATLADTAYQYLEITKENLLDSDVNKVEIKFNVEKSWLNTEGINEANIKLYRYSSNKWNALTTTKYNSDSNYVYYKATSVGLSYFAIAGKKPAAGVAEEVAEEETVGAAPTAAEEAAEEEEVAEEKITEKLTKKSWLIWLIIAIVVIALLVVFFIYIRKQEEKLQ